MFFNEFSDFSLRGSHLNKGERCWYAHFRVDNDFTRLLPFMLPLNQEAVHFDDPEQLSFKMGEIYCSLYPPDTVTARFFLGRDEAVAFARGLLALLNDVLERKAQIKPCHRKQRRLQVPEILKLLPLSNCGDCGFSACMAFAGAVTRLKTPLTGCPHLPQPIGTRILYPVYDSENDLVATVEVDADLASDAGVIGHDGYEARPAGDAELDSRPSKPRGLGLEGEREGIIFKLSGRETEVIRLMAEGFTNREISRILKISPHTVKTHVIHIFNKLGVSDRTQASVWAARNQLI